MPDRKLISERNFKHWWSIISNLDAPTLQENASSLSYLRGCEEYLGLKRLPEQHYPDFPPTDLLLKLPAFTNLEQGDLQILRGWLLLGENNLQTSIWAETLLRYAEINQSSLMKKAFAKFRSIKAARHVLLEMTVFLLDFYFEKYDLRFLNLVLKMSELRGLFYKGSLTKALGNNILRPSVLLQIRVLIMGEAAFQKLGNIQSL
jgi:hypothetical protein